MKRDCTPVEKYTLEDMIDAAGLQSVLMALSEICGEKADHIEANYNDPGLVRHWRTTEGAIGCIVHKAVNL
jgi:hypothetical protein